MGDVLSLVEKAEEAIKADEAEEMMKRVMQQKFDFNDFLTQSQMISRMGSMGSITKMLPGVCKRLFLMLYLLGFHQVSVSLRSVDGWGEEGWRMALMSILCRMALNCS